MHGADWIVFIRLTNGTGVTVLGLTKGGAEELDEKLYTQGTVKVPLNDNRGPGHDRVGYTRIHTHAVASVDVHQNLPKKETS